MQRFAILLGLLIGVAFCDTAGAYYHAQLGRFVSRDPVGFTDGCNLYAAYFAPQRLDPMGTEQEEFDPNWLGQPELCLENCIAAGIKYENCYHYCFENNSLPEDWPVLPLDGRGRVQFPTQPYPPLWIVQQQPISIESSRKEWLEWTPGDDFEMQDETEGCSCQISPDNNKVSIERPTGQLGNISRPGYGNAECRIGEVVLAEYKGVCRGKNCACEQNERGGCRYLILWRCQQNNTINNWHRHDFAGQCDAHKQKQ